MNIAVQLVKTERECTNKLQYLLQYPFVIRTVNYSPMWNLILSYFYVLTTISL